VRFVAVAVALAMLAGLVIVAVRSVTGSEAEPTPEDGIGDADPDFSLTDEEAIERFEQLNELRVQAYEGADIGLVSEFAGTGPFKTQVVDELRQLKLDDTTASLVLETEELQVTSNRPDEITLQETVIFDIRFLDEAGKDITTKGGPERFVVDWTLEYFNQGWLITESDAIEAEPIE